MTKTNTEKNTIFIQIAAYRDEELPKTIQSCLKQAEFPERLSFAIVNQYGPETKHSLDAYEANKNFAIVKIPWRQSKGVGYARHICNTLYKDQDFALQIDSHMRFEKNWDSFLISEWRKCKHPKAVLSGYPATYKYDLNGKVVYGPTTASRVMFYRFCNAYIPVFIAKTLPTVVTRPIRGSFISGGFLFSRGSVCKLVPYTAEICFIGEEIVHAIRLFTHGYRVFHPTKWVVYHFYLRSKNQKNSHHFWNDFRSSPTLAKRKTYEKMNSLSDRTTRRLLLEDDTSLLGSVNSLNDFQNYAGIKIKDKLIHPDHIGGKEPPFASDDSWAQTMAVHQMRRVTLRIPTSSFDMKIDDYDFWYFGLHDSNEVELARDDIRLSDWNVPEITIDKEFALQKEPAKYIVWPHSHSRGWLKRVVFSL